VTGSDPRRASAVADARFEERLGRVLRLGVRVSSACLAVGLILELAGAWPVLAALLFTVGLVVLMATPVARVAVSVVAYVMQRDWLFATLTAIVLFELGASLVAALVFHRRL
jgi:uncharacterized membrane protein